MAKYNGWANRDTWLVGLWLNNHESNYRFMRANKKKLMKMKKPQLIRTLKGRCHFGDKIDWTQVRITEIKRDVISTA